jgi:hypothetical protein
MGKPLPPSKELECALRVIDNVMKYADTKYWLCFGGLWALVQNDGVIPDGDLDLCTYYGTDFRKIERAFAGSPGQYAMTRAMVDDTAPENALYCSFSSGCGFPHICLSFWYLHNGIRYYCHDSLREVEGVGSPKSGFFFRGIPGEYVENIPGNFREVEWPGVNQMAKVRVPRLHVGAILDMLYPDWPYKKQRYEVRTGRVDPSRMASYHKGGAVSPYNVHVKSMADFKNGELVAMQLSKSKQEYENRVLPKP